MAWFVVLGGMLRAGLRILCFGMLTVVFVPMVLLASWHDPDGRRAYALARWWAWLNVRLCGVTVHTKGLEHLDPHRSYVFMANHRTAFDVLTLMVALSDFQLRWVTKAELARIPGFGQGLRATKPILIDRHDHASAVASLAAAREQIQGGVSAVFFPEGTRGSGSALLPFKKGGFVFAIESGTPVVPVRINGGHSFADRTSALFRSGATMDVVAHAPIATSYLTLADRDTLLAQVRATIADAAADMQWSLPMPAPRLAGVGTLVGARARR